MEHAVLLKKGLLPWSGSYQQGGMMKALRGRGLGLHTDVCNLVSFSPSPPFRSVHSDWSWGPHDASWFPGLLWSCTRVTVHAGIGEYSFCTPSLQPVLPLIPSFPKMSPGPVHRMGRTSGVRKGPRLLGFAQPFSIGTSGPALSAWLPPSR